jgi:hypothetical protein
MPHETNDKYKQYGKVAVIPLPKWMKEEQDKYNPDEDFLPAQLYDIFFIEEKKIKNLFPELVADTVDIMQYYEAKSEEAQKLFKLIADEKILPIEAMMRQGGHGEMDIFDPLTREEYFISKEDSSWDKWITIGDEKGDEEWSKRKMYAVFNNFDHIPDVYVSFRKEDAQQRYDKFKMSDKNLKENRENGMCGGIYFLEIREGTSWGISDGTPTGPDPDYPFAGAKILEKQEMEE